MIKAANIFLLVFYAFGTFCLPKGNFSALLDIPQMYRHCKATEDKDMIPLDFITDHLLNIDALFDKHENGDPQKPHRQNLTQHQAQTITFITYFEFSFKSFYEISIEPALAPVGFLPSGYTSGILRPPIA